MARRINMKEAAITITILKWLELNNWEIVAFDFPQSGMGKMLHLNSNLRGKTKNKDSIIPDIVAIRDNICLFFENKEKLTISDFDKIAAIKVTQNYTEAIQKLLEGSRVDTIYYGVAFAQPPPKISIAATDADKVDFIMTVSPVFSIAILKGAHCFATA